MKKENIKIPKRIFLYVLLCLSIFIIVFSFYKTLHLYVVGVFVETISSIDYRIIIPDSSSSYFWALGCLALSISLCLIVIKFGEEKYNKIKSFKWYSKAFLIFLIVSIPLFIISVPGFVAVSEKVIVFNSFSNNDVIEFSPTTTVSIVENYSSEWGGGGSSRGVKRSCNLSFIVTDGSIQKTVNGQERYRIYTFYNYLKSNNIPVYATYNVDSYCQDSPSSVGYYEEAKQNFEI